MEKEEALEALTNQRVSFNLGGKEYTARRATLYDLSQLLKFVRQKQSEGQDETSAGLDGTIFMLTELMKPEFDITPDDLAKTVPFNEIASINEILKSLGLDLPQTTVPASK